MALGPLKRCLAKGHSLTQTKCFQNDLTQLSSAASLNMGQSQNGVLGNGLSSVG